MEDTDTDDSLIIKPYGREKKSKSSWTGYHISAFLVTFFSYALFHVTRKTFSNVKNTISEVWSPTNMSGNMSEFYNYKQWNSHHLYGDSQDASYFLGTLDTVFMCAYSVGLFISGAAGDRFDLRKVLAFGMCSSAVAVFLFGTLSEWLHIYNLAWYVVFWVLTGLLQSTGWPTVVAIVGNWFGKSSRGLIMGIWGASPSIGNIIGSYTAASVLPYGYEYAFLVPAAMTFAGGIIVYFSIIPSPRDVGLPDPDDDGSDDTEPLLRKEDSSTAVSESFDNKGNLPKPKAINFFQAFLLPGVLPYSLAYACLKLVNYSFFFWLPYYLQNNYNWKETDADKISTWYDVGGIVGSVIGGYISDKIGSRSPIVGFLLLLSPVSLLVYYDSPNDKVINAVLMSITGFFIGGAANLISTAIAADLGRQDELKNNSEALATVTGIIDGTGSAGAAVGQILIPIIERHLSWKFVFYLFMVMTILTLVCILKIVIKDIRELYHRRQSKRVGLDSLVVNTESDSLERRRSFDS